MAGTMIAFSSRQVLPNYIGVQHMQPDRVIMMTTDEFSHVPTRLMQATGIPHRSEPIDAYDLQQAAEAVQRILADLPADETIMMNVTGGTKIMALAGVFSGLSSRFRKRVVMGYVDTRNQDLLRMHADERGKMAVESEPIELSIPFCTFVLLAGESLKSSVHPGSIPEARYDVCRLLTTDPGLEKLFNGRIQDQLADLERRPCTEGSLEIPLGRGRGRGRWHIAWKEGWGRISIPGQNDIVFPSQDPLGFFHGAWLEEYVARRMHLSGHFDEICLNAVIQLRQPLAGTFRGTQVLATDKNEFDVVVTKGPRAAIVECKSGGVSQDHIHKLVALRDHILGPFGKAFLACRFQPRGHTRHVLERAEDENITIIAAEELPHVAEIVDAELRKGAQ